MIVLAFGTNEGFRDSTDPTAYAADFAARLRELHAAAPGAALLVLGPPDGDRRRGKRSAAPGGLRRSQVDRAAEPRRDPRGAAQRRRARGRLFLGLAGGDGRRVQHDALGRDRCRPMAAPDHVHLFAPGYQATAEALFRTIMDGYARYRALRPAA